jgi:hypothetical protein
MFRTQQAVVGPRPSCQCAFESWDPTTLSTPSMIFCIVCAKSRPSSSRQCVILATRGISHPCLGSAASYPRSSRYLHRISLAQCMQCVTQHRARTRNILIENVIFLHNIVEDSLAVVVHHQHLPLRRISLALSGWRPRLTSPRVMFFMAPTITEGVY